MEKPVIDDAVNIGSLLFLLLLAAQWRAFAQQAWRPICLSNRNCPCCVPSPAEKPPLDG
jgi:hypothetical protein